MSESKSSTSIEICEVQGARGYGVDRDGGTWSRYKIRTPGGPTDTWTRLYPYPSKDGYLRVEIKRDNGDRLTTFVHTLVLRTFVGDRLPDQQCRHLDGTRTNNRLENLAWGSAWENAQDRIRHGTQTITQRPGMINPNHKLTDAQVMRVFRLRRRGMLQREIGKLFGVSPSRISEILSGRAWAHVVDDGKT